MTPYLLALSNLMHDRGRSAVSVIGAAFAVVLIFMQLGFLGATQDTATLLYNKLNFDLLITSSEYLDFSRAGTVTRARLTQASGTPGVAKVLPFSAAQGLWRNPTKDPIRGGRQWAIVMLAANPADFDDVFLPGKQGVFPTPEARDEARAALNRINTVLLDRKSRPDFGNPADMPPGTTTEFNGQRVELAGYFALGTGFSYTGLLLANEETYTNLTAESPREATFGLVTVQPGEDPSTVAARLRATLPADVLIYTRDQINAQERNYWVSKTAVGKFFYFGVILALMVGAIFVYQMMVADIKKHLPEYATLKAMGYRFHFLFWIVVWQALFLSIAGYVGGFIAALGLYELTKYAAQLPTNMTIERMVTVLLLTVGMCVGSGLIAVRKTKNADPADLF